MQPNQGPKVSVPRPRFEFKYRLSEHLAADIYRFAHFHLEPDQHSRDGDYIVNSLYFDTPDDRDAQETDEGIALRSKVRLRCYNSKPRPPYFLELKQRFGSSIYKTRAALEPEDAERIASGLPPVAAYRCRSAVEALDTIREVIDHREMTPRAWVKYDRSAWTSPWADGVRMTFDRRVETQARCGPPSPAKSWRSIGTQASGCKRVSASYESARSRRTRFTRGWTHGRRPA